MSATPIAHLVLHDRLMANVNPVPAFLRPRLLPDTGSPSAIVRVGLREDGDAAGAGAGGAVAGVAVDARDERRDRRVDAAGSRLVSRVGGQALQHHVLAIVEAGHRWT